MKELKTRAVILIIMTIGFGLVAQRSSAQGTGKLHGRIVDVMGGAISKTPVTIRNSNARHEIVTDENGEFEIGLPVGVYEVRTEEMPGFLHSKYLKVRVRRDQQRNVTIAVMHTLKGAWCVLKISSQ